MPAMLIGSNLKVYLPLRFQCPIVQPDAVLNAKTFSRKVYN